MKRFLFILWWFVTLIMAIFVAIALDNDDVSFFVLILSIITAVSMFILGKKSYEITQGQALGTDKKRLSSDTAELEDTQPTRLSAATNIAPNKLEDTQPTRYSAATNILSHELEIEAQSAQVQREKQGNELRLFGMHVPRWVILGLSFLFVMMISTLCGLAVLLYLINL